MSPYREVMRRMARVSRCDVCGKPIEQPVAKLFLAVIDNRTKGATRNTHSDYDRHADVGACCIASLTDKVRFTKRQRRPKKTVAT